jgi:hypothetical protein
MNINEVKLFLEAKNPRDLVKRMIENNRKHGMAFKYDCPQKTTTGYIVWFTANIAEYYAKEPVDGINRG